MELDQFMKELVVDFLGEVIDLFFPDFSRRLDFSQTQDLNKQFYTDSPKVGEPESQAVSTGTTG
jgi:hypothetical protein